MMYPEAFMAEVGINISESSDQSWSMDGKLQCSLRMEREMGREIDGRITPIEDTITSVVKIPLTQVGLIKQVTASLEKRTTVDLTLDRMGMRIELRAMHVRRIDSLFDHSISFFNVEFIGSQPVVITASSDDG